MIKQNLTEFITMAYAICRLCFNVKNEEMSKLSDESGILRIIRSCLSIDITINEVFPSHICKGCINKIEEINEFCSSVKDNEYQLQQHFENDTPYILRPQDIDVKEESCVQNIGVQKASKDEESMNDSVANTYKEENDEIDGIKETASIKDTIINKPNESELMKDEETVDIDSNEPYSSEEEDNITLSSLKEQNKHNGENITDKKHVEENSSITLKKSRRILIEPFNCLSCDKVCDSNDKLREHYKEDHTVKIDDNTTFTKILSNGKTMYKCDKCKKIYAKMFLKRHILHHSNERPYICKLCARTYKTVFDIMQHGIRAHSEPNLQCSFKCGFSTAYPAALKDHENIKHKNIFKYTCSTCGKGFLVKSWCEQHQNMHTGLKPFVCDICGAAFHFEKYLAFHRSNMHPQSKAKKPFICLRCNVKCDCARTLALHLEKEHGVMRKKRAKQKLKKSLCQYCGKILNHPEQLVQHRRKHLGEKPFKCSICNKGFQSKFSRSVHERAHAQERAHACTYQHCGKRYTQRSALLRHQKLHHGSPR